jgi:hypothetical protein
MSSIQLGFVTVVLLAALALINSAQQQHLARDWYCVRQPFLETTDGDLIALRCVAALPKSEKLDAEDEDILTKLEVVRHNAMTFRQLGQENPKNWPMDTGKGKEMMDALRMGFGQKVGQLCQKPPGYCPGSALSQSDFRLDHTLRVQEHNCSTREVVHRSSPASARDVFENLGQLGSIRLDRIRFCRERPAARLALLSGGEVSPQ